jgi:predicted nucleotidyltransferase
MISLRSAITQKVLNYFFINPDESIYVNELSRQLHAEKRNLVKKLKELEKEGILQSRISGNLKFFSINKRYPLYKDYKNIVLKTTGLEKMLKKIADEVPGIEQIFIYGSYAHSKMANHSDIDLLVVGNHEIVALQKKLNDLQGELGREINAINMNKSEFEKRLRDEDPFILNIVNKKNIKIAK